MIKIAPSEISGNAIDRIGRQWLLLTVEKEGMVNTMTCSWGGLGVLWNMPSATVYVRPQRHTFGFMEAADRFTVSFLPESYRAALNLLGSKSGRDGDKIAESGLAVARYDGLPAFEEAEIVLCCRKLYSQFLSGENFNDRDIIGRVYPRGDFHKMFVGEITAAYHNEAVEN